MLRDRSGKLYYWKHSRIRGVLEIYSDKKTVIVPLTMTNSELWKVVILIESSSNLKD